MSVKEITVGFIGAGTVGGGAIEIIRRLVESRALRNLKSMAGI
jgi:homoserine dehydrogenase